MNKKNAWLLIWTLMLWGRSARVQDESANASIQAMVSPGCYISMLTDVTFIDMDGIFVEDIDSASGSITVVCTLGTSYSLGISNGLNAVGGMRRMVSNNGSYFIHYQLFRDGAHQSPWGETGTQDVMPGVGTGQADTHTIYARIPHGQNPVVLGPYSDQVVVTLNF